MSDVLRRHSSPPMANVSQSASATDAFRWKNIGNTAKKVKSCCVIHCTIRFRENSGRSGFFSSFLLKTAEG